MTSATEPLRVVADPWIDALPDCVMLLPISDPYRWPEPLMVIGLCGA